MILITFFLTLIVIVITILSCISDVKSLRIPNWHSLVILAVFIPAWFLSPESFTPLWQHASAMAIMFAVSYIMFAFRIMGGGDSKLATVLGLWIGLQGLMPFILSMSIVGGLIGFISLIIRKKKPFKNPAKGSWVETAQAGGNSIPYGIAIAVGSWITILHTGFLLNQLDEVFRIIH